jgi:hypothetical protein
MERHTSSLSSAVPDRHRFHGLQMRKLPASISLAALASLSAAPTRRLLRPSVAKQMLLSSRSRALLHRGRGPGPAPAAFAQRRRASTSELAPVQHEAVVKGLACRPWSLCAWTLVSRGFDPHGKRQIIG